MRWGTYGAMVRVMEGYSRDLEEVLECDCDERESVRAHDGLRRRSSAGSTAIMIAFEAWRVPRGSMSGESKLVSGAVCSRFVSG